MGTGVFINFWYIHFVIVALLDGKMDIMIPALGAI